MNQLPDPTTLKRLLQSMAALDAVLSPEWEYRYYSFQADWSPDEEMAGIRNGCGDDVYVLFNAHGCFVKGYAHEYWRPERPPSYHYDPVPAVFQSGVAEPAFAPDDVSFCLWWLAEAPGWQGLETADNAKSGGLFLLDDLDVDPRRYQVFAKAYYEVDISKTDVASIYAHDPMTDALAHRLNPTVDLKELTQDLVGIGYPASQ